MLPKINGKSFLECTEEDLKGLIDNEAYREDEYIDYKKTFSFLEKPKGRERDVKKAEYKSDVCSFANAAGGYMLFGISENNGCASELLGIDIPDDNKDKYELDRRNDLNGIMPRSPYVQFNFVKLENGKYIIIMYIRHDGFAPYLHIQDEKNYLIYKRNGNGKRIVMYDELKTMFNQSLSLEKEILSYRKQRIEHFKSNASASEGSFILLEFIPETFLDSNYNQNMYALEKNKNINFSSIFSQFNCSSSMIPCVDGLRYIPMDRKYDYGEGYVNNNGIVEGCFYIVPHPYGDGKTIPWLNLWNRIRLVCYEYIKKFSMIDIGERVFICLSIVGCKDMKSENNFNNDYIGLIDREIVLCDPILIEKLEDEKETHFMTKKLQLSFLLSIGVKYDGKLKALIDEIYG